MRKKLITLLSVLVLAISFLGFTQLAYAGQPFDEVCTGVPANDSTVCNERGNTSNPLTGTGGILVRAARLLSLFIGIISVIIIIYGGIKYVVSSGDASNINSAKETVLYACIGLVVALLAQGIIVLVVNGLT